MIPSFRVCLAALALLNFSAFTFALPNPLPCTHTFSAAGPEPNPQPVAIVVIAQPEDSGDAIALPQEPKDQAEMLITDELKLKERDDGRSMLGRDLREKTSDVGLTKRIFDPSNYQNIAIVPGTGFFIAYNVGAAISMAAFNSLASDFLGQLQTQANSYSNGDLTGLTPHRSVSLAATFLNNAGELADCALLVSTASSQMSWQSAINVVNILKIIATQNNNAWESEFSIYTEPFPGFYEGLYSGSFTVYS